MQCTTALRVIDKLCDTEKHQRLAKLRGACVHQVMQHQNAPEDAPKKLGRFYRYDDMGASQSTASAINLRMNEEEYAKSPTRKIG